MLLHGTGHMCSLMDDFLKVSGWSAYTILSCMVGVNLSSYRSV